VKFGKRSINLIVNRVRPAMVRSGKMLGVSDVMEILAIGLIGIVPEDDSVVVSTNKGEPLAMANLTPAAKAFEKIAGRILGKDIPLQDIDDLDERGFLVSLKKIFGRRGGRY